MLMLISYCFRLHPKKALQDLSVSLQIDDSEDNELAYLHRGILYYAIGKYVQYQSVISVCTSHDVTFLNGNLK